MISRMKNFSIALAVIAAIAVPAKGQAKDELDEFSAGLIKFMDNLKTCTPYTLSYPHPFVDGFTERDTIKGKKADKCVVTYLIPIANKTTGKFEGWNSQCEFSAETIKLMTSKEQYQSVLDGDFGGSTDDPVSKRKEKECKLEPVSRKTSVK
jgi:hypothetical protein